MRFRYPASFPIYRTHPRLFSSDASGLFHVFSVSTTYFLYILLNTTIQILYFFFVQPKYKTDVCVCVCGRLVVCSPYKFAVSMHTNDTI